MAEKREQKMKKMKKKGAFQPFLTSSQTPENHHPGATPSLSALTLLYTRAIPALTFVRGEIAQTRRRAVAGRSVSGQ
ncbi:MAG: hypothetical protein IKC19_00535 [Bacteroidales bacterium]|nr:hypothetical protein [Bacteroidales bacterium]